MYTDSIYLYIFLVKSFTQNISIFVQLFFWFIVVVYMYCSKCGKEIADNATRCQYCSNRTLVLHESLRMTTVKTKSPGVAATLSFFIPGLGQIYNGKILSGFAVLFLTPIITFFSILMVFNHFMWIFLPLIWWIYFVAEAYRYAQKVNDEVML